jgi:glycosyltransferase involved in cell wall biosynthesis
MRILHVIDALDGQGNARQVELLAIALAQDGVAIEVCCLGSASRQVDRLHAAGIAVHVLGWRRWLNAPALWTLRHLIRGRSFDVIHAWRLPALRVLAVVAPEALPRALVSGLSPGARFNWYDRRLLGRVRSVTIGNDADRRAWQQHGLVGRRCVRAPITLAARQITGENWAAPYPRRIGCTGRLERGRGFREAIWAVDVLRYVFPDVHLLITGAGPYRPDLEAMIERLGIRNAHLLGDSVDPAELLAAADVCWVPSRSNVGRQAALEAMAAGRAVVASDVPCLRDVIRDGETGCLVPPGEPVALARRTRALLQDPARRARLGEAARTDVLQQCAVERGAASWRVLYNDLTA